MNSGHNSSVLFAHEQALFLYKQCDFSNCLIVLPLYPAIPQSETLPDTRKTEVDQKNVREPIYTQCERDFAQRDSWARTLTPIPTTHHSDLCDSGKARRKLRAKSKTSCRAMVGSPKANEARCEQIRNLEAKKLEWRQKAELERHEFECRIKAVNINEGRETYPNEENSEEIVDESRPRNPLTSEPLSSLLSLLQEGNDLLPSDKDDHELETDLFGASDAPLHLGPGIALDGSLGI